MDGVKKGKILSPIVSIVGLIAPLLMLCSIYSPLARGETAITVAHDKERFSEYLRYPWEVMQIGSVATSYKKVFAPYLALKWVSYPVLGDAGTLVDDPVLGPVVLYVICRPHACGTERLVFVYKPSTGQAWGRVKIISDVIGTDRSNEAANLIGKYIGEMK